MCVRACVCVCVCVCVCARECVWTSLEAQQWKICLQCRSHRRHRFYPWVGNPLQWVTHFSVFTWRIPWTEEPGRLWSIRLWRVRHDWSDWASTYTSETVTVTYAKKSDSSPPKVSFCLFHLIVVVVAYVTAQNLSVVYSVINYRHYNYFTYII